MLGGALEVGLKTEHSLIDLSVVADLVADNEAGRTDAAGSNRRARTVVDERGVLICECTTDIHAEEASARRMMEFPDLCNCSVMVSPYRVLINPWVSGLRHNGKSESAKTAHKPLPNGAPQRRNENEDDVMPAARAA